MIHTYDSYGMNLEVFLPIKSPIISMYSLIQRSIVKNISALWYPGTLIWFGIPLSKSIFLNHLNSIWGLYKVNYNISCTMMYMWNCHFNGITSLLMQKTGDCRVINTNKNKNIISGDDFRESLLSVQHMDSLVYKWDFQFA